MIFQINKYTFFLSFRTLDAELPQNRLAQFAFGEYDINTSLLSDCRHLIVGSSFRMLTNPKSCLASWSFCCLAVCLELWMVNLRVKQWNQRAPVADLWVKLRGNQGSLGKVWMKFKVGQIMECLKEAGIAWSNSNYGWLPLRGIQDMSDSQQSLSYGRLLNVFIGKCRLEEKQRVDEQEITKWRAYWKVKELVAKTAVPSKEREAQTRKWHSNNSKWKKQGNQVLFDQS